MQRLTLALLSFLPAVLPAQGGETVDQQAVDILRKNGLEQSQVMDILSWICDVHGPRLTGSPGIRRAQEWAKGQLAEWGLDARLEPWGPFGRGWQLERVAMHVVGDNPWPILVYPKAWSPGIAATEADVVLAADMEAEDLAAMDLTGKVVLVETEREVAEPFDGISNRFDSEQLLALADGRQPERSPRAASRSRGDDFRRGFQRRAAIMRVLAEKKPLALIDRSFKGDYGTVFVGGASASSSDGGRGRAYAADAEVVPQFTMAIEHYNRIARLLKKGQPVRLALELEVSFHGGEEMEHNVVAELPGTDPALRDQVVMMGAHFDSWHTGTGCTDNGAGSAVMMEAMRLLTLLAKERGEGPRRTVRIGLWSGEEQGLLGSRAYVSEHFARSGGRGQPPSEILPAHAKLSGYFNLDNGTGRVRGVYLQGNEAVAPMFRAWLRPFHDIGASTLTLSNTGGTDHLSFDAVGLPGFQFIQDPVSYDSRTHHSNMDVWDHAVAEDLQQAATIVASFVWHTAQRDEMLPRKAMPEASEAAGRRGR